MKIVAPLSNISCFEPLLKAGADEFYCGFIPFEWLNRYDGTIPLNRRETFAMGSIYDWASMKILAKKMNVFKIPINITFNTHFFITETYPVLFDIIKRIGELGFVNIIIADFGVLEYLRKINYKMNIHLSGELAIFNHLALEFFDSFGIRRLIFPRKTRIKDIEPFIRQYKRVIEFEAFILKTLCRFSGGFCHSIHSVELPHSCLIPHRLKVAAIPGERKEKKFKKISFQQTDYKVGSSGCGLCRLKELISFGITHLKIVGRGIGFESLSKDIGITKRVIAMAENTDNVSAFRSKVMEKIFKGNCPKNIGMCYYP